MITAEAFGFLSIRFRLGQRENMIVNHRRNSDERQHYLLENHYTFKLKPRLLYVGSLDKNGGWTEEPHSHDCLEIIFITDGKGNVTVDGKTFSVKKGDLIIYNMGVTHYEKSNEKDPMESLFFACDKLQITNFPPNNLLPDYCDPVFHTEEMYTYFYKYFMTLITEFKQKERFYKEICQNVLKTLVMYIFRLISRTMDAPSLLDSSLTLEPVLAYIDANYTRKLTLDEIAEQCYMSKYHLSHTFTRVHGVSIGKYILNKKIEESKLMLTESKTSVADIAESLGFDDTSYYCRVFKKSVGITPSAYRRRSVIIAIPSPKN